MTLWRRQIFAELFGSWDFVVVWPMKTFPKGAQKYYVRGSRVGGGTQKLTLILWRGVVVPANRWELWRCNFSEWNWVWFFDIVKSGEINPFPVSGDSVVLTKPKSEILKCRSSFIFSFYSRRIFGGEGRGGGPRKSYVRPLVVRKNLTVSDRGWVLVQNIGFCLRIMLLTPNARRWIRIRRGIGTELYLEASILKMNLIFSIEIGQKFL